MDAQLFARPLVVLCLIVGFASDNAWAQPIAYVDKNAPGANDGTSWTNAFHDLQDALAAAGTTGNGITEIRVADGTYTPDGESGSRFASFTLLKNLALRGGYAGYGAADADLRNIATYETILSGDLAGDDGSLFTNYEENSYHVLFVPYTTTTGAVLDGFTIQGGSANSSTSPDLSSGGGMFIQTHGVIDLVDCTFVGNSAFSRGGAINIGWSFDPVFPTFSDCRFRYNRVQGGAAGAVFIDAGSQAEFRNCVFEANMALFPARAGAIAGFGSPVFTDCVFTNNWGWSAGAVDNSGFPIFSRCTFLNNTAGPFSPAGQNGGAIVSLSPATVTDCVFAGNFAGTGGGAISAGGSTQNVPFLVVNSVFRGNTAGHYGGAVHIGQGDNVVFIGCLFHGNSAGDKGGAVYNRWAPHPSYTQEFTHCTFVGNIAGFGGGLVNEEAYVTLTNCVLWNNVDDSGMTEEAQFAVEESSVVTVDYSSVQGWTGTLPGVGTTGTDPMFVDADGPDDIVGTDDDNLRLSPASPLVNAGDRSMNFDPGATDLDGHSRMLCGLADLGAYEFGLGDFDCDRDVDLDDFAEFSINLTGPDPAAFPCSAACIPFDADHNQRLDLRDWGAFTRQFAGAGP